MFYDRKGNDNEINKWENNIIPELKSTISYFNNIENQYVLILQRGVDPYSPLYDNDFELGKVFGFDDTKSIRIQTKTRLNVPIQALSPTSTSSMQGVDNPAEILFDSYFLQPINPLSFKTNAIGYYTNTAYKGEYLKKGFKESNKFTSNLIGLRVSDDNLLENGSFRLTLISNKYEVKNGYNKTDNLTNHSSSYLENSMLSKFFIKKL